MAKTALKPGEKAPVFTLADQNGTSAALSGFSRRWVVLCFYPKDDTPGYTSEACEFTDGIQAFGEPDAVVLGCSADSPESHRRLIAKHGLKVTLLSDPDHSVMAAFGAWGEKSVHGRASMGVIRSTVVIGPSGNVAFYWPKVKAAGHAEKVREKLTELRGN